MHREDITYKDPIILINDKLKKYGHMRQFNNNALSVLLHLFYSFGNAYKYIEENGVSYICYETLVYDDEDKREDKSDIEIYEKHKDSYQEIVEKYENGDFEDMFKENPKSEQHLKDVIKNLKSQLDEMEKEIADYLNFKPFTSLEELKNVEFDIENVYWVNLDGIISHYSMATEVPDNLSTEWKQAFNILTNKMLQADCAKVQKALDKAEKQRKEWA